MSGDETRRLHPRAALAATVEAATAGARTVDTTAEAGGERAGGPLPAAMGRYRIVRRIGSGGMGVVYEGHDPQLDRPVAIKILHERVRARGHLAERLHREARALARVTHANVVSVYDVGVDDGEVYVVMQYVDGETLDHALAKHGRDRAAVLACFDAAGRGLAAAHAAELVHRDFKPSNVLVDGGGAVRVTDFGLARVSDLAEAPDVGGGELAASMTRGELVGTPAYMAPEQFRGGPITAAADQFSFCVALWEALCGARPFAGDSVDTIRDAVLAGAVVVPAADRRLPRGLERVLRRGLAVDPAARYPSMDALLAALAPRRRARIAAIAGAGAGAVAIGAAAVIALRPAPAPAKPPPGPPVLARAPAAPAAPLTDLGGCAYSPAFLDDDTVIFDLTRGGAVDLYRLDLGAAKPVQLTSDPGWEWAASPGAPGEIVYARQGGAFDGIEIMDLASGARRPLATIGGPSAFAGGDYYHAPDKSSSIRRLRGGRDEIWMTLAEGRRARKLVRSPDGTRLATLVQDSSDNFAVCTIALDRAALTCLPLTAGEARPAFSSDGAALYLDAGERIDRVELASGAVATVVPDAAGAGGLAVAPGGGALVYSACRRHTELVDVTTDPPVALGEAGAIQPAAGPDGALAYVRHRGAQRILTWRRADGHVEELVAGADVRFLSISFAAGGNWLTYVMSGDRPGIHVLAIGGRAAPNRITESASDSRPVFAGDRIVFTRRDAAGSPRLMTVDPDGADERVASPRPRIVIGADLARDRVLLSSPAYDHLYWWDPRTGAETAGPRAAWDEIPTYLALAPGGDWLLVGGGNNGQKVWRMSLVTGALEPVVELPGDATALSGTIDDRGHPLIAVDRWAGELWIAKPPPGTRW